VVHSHAHFRFGGRGEDHAHDAAGYVDGAIEGKRRAIGERHSMRVSGMRAEKEMIAGAAAGMSFRQAGRVGVDMQEHVAGMKASERLLWSWWHSS
jgi:hypothetical protein